MVRVAGGRAWLGDRELVVDRGEGGDVFAHDGRAYELVGRGDALALRVRDPRSPARAAFAGLAYYPVDPAWRVIASLRPYAEPRAVTYDYGEGETGELPVRGALVFEAGGGSWTLEAAWEGRRFLVLFADPTNRDDTYPAGRFLYADPAPDGRVVLDFNKAMNPACAFSAHVRCPLPGARNRIGVRVEAGERRYAAG